MAPFNACTVHNYTCLFIRLMDDVIHWCPFHPPRVGFQAHHTSSPPPPLHFPSLLLLNPCRCALSPHSELLEYVLTYIVTLLCRNVRARSR
uniref:Uncharacterized protein n=1 Tax=Physcomitrium patens TaxID=3218 RepID=A0A2K1KI36_PHYPA|nr:hypothetical protein PHYPA_007131 [Physcomitrium patens]